MHSIPYNLWILKAKGENTSFGGNLGYPDIPSEFYVYDDTVKNCKKINVGDYVTIVDERFIIGFACITKIEIEDKVPKIRFRCPICNIQEHYIRKNILPKHKCRNKHVFDEPIEQNIEVKRFTASYKSTFIKAEAKTSVQILTKYYIKKNRYYSIQRCAVEFLQIEFPKILNSLNSKEKKIKNELSNAVSEHKDPYIPTFLDTREFKNSKRPNRKGQKKFKKYLVDRYGNACMLTGCNIPIAVEASHIVPYRGDEDNHPANGLLLRNDLHTLFDANLLTINPNTFKVVVSPSIKYSYYGKYEGMKIIIKTTGISPSIEALKIRWHLFTMKWPNKV